MRDTDFDEADFCVSDEGHPDEFIIRESSVPVLPPPQQNVGSRSTSPLRQVVPQQNNNYNQQRPAGAGLPPRPPQTPTPMNSRPNGNGNGFGQRPYQPGANNQQTNRPPQQAQRPQGFGNNGNNSATNNSSYGQKPGPHSTANGSGSNGNSGAANGLGEVEGTPWLSARAIAKASDGDALAVVAPSIQAGHLFNPKAESPSIRKTPGFDHNSSKPIPRLNRPAGGSALPPSTNAASNVGSAGALVATNNASTGAVATGGMATRSGANHTGMEPIRRIGAPPSAASPLANRNQFRPPPMKRGPPTDTPGGVPRPPLADVPSNVSANGGTVVAASALGGAGAVGVDVKRQKLA